MDDQTTGKCVEGHDCPSGPHGICCGHYEEGQPLLSLTITSDGSLFYLNAEGAWDGFHAAETMVELVDRIPGLYRVLALGEDAEDAAAALAEFHTQGGKNLDQIERELGMKGERGDGC